MRPENTANTLPRQNQATQITGGFERKHETCHLHFRSWGPHRNRTTSGPEQKLPFPFWNVTAGEDAKSGRPVQVQENQVHGMLGNWRGRGAPLPMWPPPQFIISWPRRTLYAMEPPLCGWPASDLSLEMFRPGSNDSRPTADSWPLLPRSELWFHSCWHLFWEPPPRCPLGTSTRG